MLSNSKIWESNFIEKSSKPKPEENNKKRLRKGNSKNCKCKTLKERPEKEKSDKSKKKKEWKWSLDKWCYKSSPDKTRSNRWPNKNEEWNK